MSTVLTEVSFKTINTDVLNNIVQSIININTKHRRKADAKYEFKQYVGRLRTDDEIKTIDYLLSCALQVQKKQLMLNFNFMSNVSDESKAAADELITSFDYKKFKRLPLLYQRALWFIYNPYLVGLFITDIKPLVKRFYYVKVNVGRKCKRCYEPSDGDLCPSCVSKIESCVEYCAESFTTSGTTIESFEHKFKDWLVQVTTRGEYTFTRLDESDVTYQPKLPITNYRNFLVLIG